MRKGSLRLLGIVAVSLVALSGAASAQDVGKYCVVYKGETAQSRPALSNATRATCKTQSANGGGDGYGLGCQATGGDVIMTAKTPNEADQAPDFASWGTTDTNLRDACTRLWGGRP